MSDSRDLTARAADAAMEQPLPVRQSDNLLAQVIAAAKDPQIDAEKMKTLAELVNGQQDRERELEFNRDFNAAQMDMPVITRDGVITIPAKDGRPARTQGRFARFEDIDRVVRPILQRYNLAIRFEIGEAQGAITVRPILSHANGYTERGEAMRLPADKSGSKNDTQAVGSASSYGKRYTMCAMLNIVTEGIDDDGNGGRQTAVHLTFEREQLVREEAEAAANAGKYIEWFGQQSPKDRAWLVNQQFHVDFGGQPLLTSQPKVAKRTEPESTPPPPPPPPPPPAAERTDASTSKRTPEQMVEDFKKRLDGAATSKEVVDLQSAPNTIRWIENLEQRFPALHQQVVDHAATRYADLAAAERERARTNG